MSTEGSHGPVRFVSQVWGFDEPRQGYHVGFVAGELPSPHVPLGLPLAPPASSGKQRVPPQCESLYACRRARSFRTTSGLSFATLFRSYMSSTTSKSSVWPATYPDDGGTLHGRSPSVQFPPQDEDSGGGCGGSYRPSARGGGVQPYGHHGAVSFEGSGSGEYGVALLFAGPRSAQIPGKTA